MFKDDKRKEVGEPLVRLSPHANHSLTCRVLGVAGIPSGEKTLVPLVKRCTNSTFNAPSVPARARPGWFRNLSPTWSDVVHLNYFQYTSRGSVYILILVDSVVERALVTQS